MNTARIGQQCEIIAIIAHKVSHMKTQLIDNNKGQIKLRKPPEEKQKESAGTYLYVQ